MAVPAVRDNWQRTMRGTASTLKHLFDHEGSLLSDVSFQTTDENGKVQVFHAHR
jgi:hypothetical protein